MFPVSAVSVCWRVLRPAASVPMFVLCYVLPRARTLYLYDIMCLCVTVWPSGIYRQPAAADAWENSLKSPVFRCKVRLRFDICQTNGGNMGVFQKKLQKHFVSSRKSYTFAFAFQKTQVLSYRF